IGRFEQLMGRHSIYKYFFDAEGGFPHDFALESVVMGRAPFFVLPQFLNEEETEALAREFGYYFSPMFVQPPMPNGNEDAAVYRADFAHMRRVFHEFAPHVAFVYTVDVANTDIAEEFYPGDGYTDWVGVHALASISPLRQFKGDVLTAVDQVYFAFQERKPMFVTIGISRQSNFDFIYRPRLAAEELRRVYTALLTDYPRVKGIIYMNVNEIRQGGAQNISDNYLITDDNMLKSTYRELVANENVIVQVAPGRAGMLSHETMRSRYSALRVGGNYYLHERTLTDELHVQRNRQRGRPRNSDGARYYPFATLNQGNEWILQSNEAHIMIIPRF
ncbi:MAG: hypothetical protein FWD96_02910, partial [Defluviitaleaceae bacterium]|nr:hypothetical protein [Defluviitaleaceae bacterium]